ncbi:hypothetical protein BDQ94DRAFT_141298 [Aspergillus welwitschiae]|uniref:Uncharacterized protein n=1 Tax=Aspergillus welwitschiae TaxID=1341132 RepID=A0A3F3Q5A9_9EURO|nr:hypothetical protein BDQ94DRAFT_141298 [Aspergillus welwitschiae]RDH34333.1 hypothetical protein BDQ94DRAFT_141298 [Aspergillus welwitschiae]
MEQHQKLMANISIGAEHQRVEFPTKANRLPTGFPPVLARRGVPEFMWDQDMYIIRHMADKLSKDQSREIFLVCFTCGLSICFYGAAVDKFNGRLRTYVNGMNARYAPYGVVWEMRWIPYSGTYMSYET